jgi:hypothetical protein
MARTLKSKLDGLWSAVNTVQMLADEGYLDDDLKPKYPLEDVNHCLREEYGYQGYESDEALEEDLKLVRDILEKGEY